MVGSLLAVLSFVVMVGPAAARPPCPDHASPTAMRIAFASNGPVASGAGGPRADDALAGEVAQASTSFLAPSSCCAPWFSSGSRQGGCCSLAHALRAIPPRSAPPRARLILRAHPAQDAARRSRLRAPPTPPPDAARSV
jgi:hypothetical protein